MNRRRFIRIAGGAIALAGAPAAARAIASADAPKAPAGGWGGFTPNADFYVTTYGSTPRVDAGQWRLKIHGLVKNSLELDLAAVKALPPVNETLTLECIGNPPNGTAIGNATWAGQSSALCWSARGPQARRFTRGSAPPTATRLASRSMS